MNNRNGSEVFRLISENHGFGSSFFQILKLVTESEIQMVSDISNNPSK